jgi:hypothetical protein
MVRVFFADGVAVWAFYNKRHDLTRWHQSMYGEGVPTMEHCLAAVRVVGDHAEALSVMHTVVELPVTPTTLLGTLQELLR